MYFKLFEIPVCCDLLLLEYLLTKNNNNINVQKSIVYYLFSFNNNTS